MPFIKKNKPGFTLTELLVVSAMVSIIALTMYSVLNNGLKVWKKVNQPLAQEDMDIFMERFSHEIRNAVKFTGMNFAGSKYNLEFPALLNSRSLNKFTVGMVSYSYYPNDEKLTHSERDFSQAASVMESTPGETLANVKSLSFKYYNYDQAKKEYLWLDNWDKPAMPLAVRMELEFKDGNKIGTFSRTVSVLIGG